MTGCDALELLELDEKLAPPGEPAFVLMDARKARSTTAEARAAFAKYEVPPGVLEGRRVHASGSVVPEIDEVDCDV